jgi:hypothetical protein
LEINNTVETIKDVAGMVKDSAEILWDHFLWAVDDIQSEVLDRPSAIEENKIVE